MFCYIFPVYSVVSEPGYRRRGIGLEAARLMISFGKSSIVSVFITISGCPWFLTRRGMIIILVVSIIIDRKD